MPGPKLDQVNIVSADLDASVAFYRRLGIDMREPARSPSGAPFHAGAPVREGAVLEADSAPFARLWCEGWASEAELAGRVVIGIRLESRAEVDRLYAEVTAAGHNGLQPPYDAFWGARYAVVEDPDGIAVGLMSPRDGPHGPPPPIE